MEPRIADQERTDVPLTTWEKWLRGASWLSLTLLMLVWILQLLCLISALTGPIENRINLMGVAVLMPYALGLGAVTLGLEYSIEQPRPAFQKFCWCMLAAQSIFFVFG